MTPQARCGRRDEHGAHTFLETYGQFGWRRSWCAGNRNIVVAIESPFVRRAKAGELPAKAVQ